MNPTSILTLITTLAPLLSSVVGLFPAIGGALSGLFGGAAPTANGQAVSLLQEGLNVLQSTGKATFEGQAGVPNSPLVVDGNFGGRTFAAVKAVQAAFGFPVTEPLASIEMNILATVLSKL